VFANAIEPHQAVTGPTLNVKSIRTAGSVLASTELIHLIRKGQFAIDGIAAMLFADQFSTLAGMVRSA
jgi:putative transposase